MIIQLRFSKFKVYPFLIISNLSFLHYATVALKSKTIFFGGAGSKGQIVEYNGDWHVTGSTLNQPRYGYSAINVGGTTMIIGGSSTKLIH